MLGNTGKADPLHFGIRNVFSSQLRICSVVTCTMFKASNVLEGRIKPSRWSIQSRSLLSTSQRNMLGHERFGKLVKKDFTLDFPLSGAACIQRILVMTSSADSRTRTTRQLQASDGAYFIFSRWTVSLQQVGCAFTVEDFFKSVTVWDCKRFLVQTFILKTRVLESNRVKEDIFIKD